MRLYVEKYSYFGTFPAFLISWEWLSGTRIVICYDLREVDGGHLRERLPRKYCYRIKLCPFLSSSKIKNQLQVPKYQNFPDAHMLQVWFSTCRVLCHDPSPSPWPMDVARINLSRVLSDMDYQPQEYPKGLYENYYLEETWHLPFKVLR